MRDADLARRPVLAQATRLLPPTWGLGAIPHFLSQRYFRPGRRPVAVRSHGVRFVVTPDNQLESFLLYAPQFYDRKEVRFLRRQLRPGDRFLDLGGFIGFYSLIAARHVGPTGRVLCVEMDPRNVARIHRNRERNGAGNVTVRQAAAAGTDGHREVRLNASHDSAYNSLHQAQGAMVVPTDLRTIPTLLREWGEAKVDGAKLDVEGLEHEVLQDYFTRTPDADLPRFLIVERSQEVFDQGAPDPHPLLEERGYALVGHNTWNYFYVRGA